MAINLGAEKRLWLQLSGTMILFSLISVSLLIGGAVRGGGEAYSYMVWNLFLAWLPLLFILWLYGTLQRKRWSSWEGIIVSLLWLFFLPNSFYIVSDLIHIQEAVPGEVLYDSVMFMSFALNGLLLGYISLYLFHSKLKARTTARTARRTVAFILLLCSFAIYLGRDLRWNTWDIFVNPAGLLFDISSRFINPLSYPRMFVVTGVFFVLLMTLYYVGWNLMRVVKANARRVV